ncbi:MAG: hypothetical protein FAF05_05220, partial [Epsilonproteobacteria bacterium]|nr:hypothetical protein [Campylobacterota bacterium]
MKKGLSAILLALGLSFFISGCSTMHMGWTAVTKAHTLDDHAMEAYDEMFTKVTKYGDPARAMMIEAKIADDVTNDDAVEAIKAITEDRNMRVT